MGVRDEGEKEREREIDGEKETGASQHAIVVKGSRAMRMTRGEAGRQVNAGGHLTIRGAYADLRLCKSSVKPVRAL